jgi:RNA-directed DNA polymerase
MGFRKSLGEIVERAGFKLNPSKTRMSLRKSRQMVTGLVINEKPNIRQSYYRNVRAMCNSLFKTGQWHKPNVDADRLAAMVSDIEPLEGMLSHIYFLKARRDRTHKANKNVGYVAPKAPIEQYRKFLFYKYFVVHNVQTLVTEGLTDVVYLKCAIRSRAAFFPTLAVTNKGKHKSKVEFLRATDTLRSVLNLGNGVAGQASLIAQYENKLKNYERLPLTHPIIIVCDNDSGLKDIIGSVKKQKAGPILSKTTTKSFYYIGNNLYLVKIPEGNPATSRRWKIYFLRVRLVNL